MSIENVNQRSVIGNKRRPNAYGDGEMDWSTLGQIVLTNIYNNEIFLQLKS